MEKCPNCLNVGSVIRTAIEGWKSGDLNQTEFLGKIYSALTLAEDHALVLSSYGGIVKVPVVDEVKPDVMWGDTATERKLNAYLTKTFVDTRSAPADASLAVAKEILNGNLESTEQLFEHFKKYYWYALGPEEDARLLANAEELSALLVAWKI